MRTKEELRRECGHMLRKLREESGLSMSAMARNMYVDDHTWKRYEEGKSAPTLPDFIWMFRTLGESALRTVLDFMYPSIYKGLNVGSDAKKLRKACVHYFEHIAPDDVIKLWDYLVFGDHGSNITPQLHEFVMIDHLPMEYRYAVAKMVLTFWELAEARGELVNTGSVMPDVDIFAYGVIKGGEAARGRKTGYTTAGRD